MYRLIAIMMLLLSFSATVLAGLGLYSSLSQSQQTFDWRLPEGLPAQNVSTAAAAPRPFRPIFGLLIPQESLGSETPMPTPATDFGHVLKGVISSGELRWAVLSGRSGDQFLREGDEIGGGVLATIFADAVYVDVDGQRLRLSFDNRARTKVADIEPSLDPTQNRATEIAVVPWRSNQQVAMFQGVSPDEFAKSRLDAEQRRRRQGWIP